jgi:TetR/AcrR family transcriptional repressor of nem operon
MATQSVREQILAAGMTAFLNRGFNASGVQEITDLAGVPKGSLYNHFASKEALGAEIVDVYARCQVRRAELQNRSVTPLERLRRHFDGLTEMFVELDFERGCLLGNFSAELADQSVIIRDRLRALFASWTADLASVIRQAQQDGSIASASNASDLAAFILDAYEGSLLRARVERDRHPLDLFKTLIFERILA